MDQEVFDTADTPLPDEAPVSTEAEQVQAAQPAEPAAAPEVTPETPPQDAPKKNGVQKRIDELTRERYEAQRQADHWRQVAEQRAQQPQRTEASNPPRLEEYQDVDSFLNARDAWVLEQAEARIFQKAQEQSQRNQVEQQQQQREVEQQIRVERFKAQEMDAVTRYPDYAQAVAMPHIAQAVQARPDILENVLDSEHGADIAYYLAKNPAQLQTLTALSPLAAVREIGRIEQMFMGSPRKQATNAPDPVRTVGGKAEAGRNPENMSIPEYRKWRANQSRS